MTKRQNVKVCIHQQSVYGSLVDDSKFEADTLKELIEWLGEKLDEVPDEYKDSAKLEIESVGGYEGEHHAEVEIFYSRPETDVEMSARVAEDLRRAEHRTAQELQTLAALKAKYGA